MTPEAQAAATGARYRDALHVREFRALFGAYVLSVTGSVVAAVALMVLVWDTTRSSLLASLTFAIGFVPYLASGTLLSAVVDRVPLRRLLVACDLTCATLVAAMATPGMPVAGLLALLFATGMVASIGGGGRSALLPVIVTRAAFVPARSLFRIAAQSAQIVGNGAGGLLLLVLSPREAILINAASYLLSATLMRLGVHRRERILDPSARPALLRDSLHGLRDVFEVPQLRRVLLLGWLVPTFAVAPEALAAPYVSGLGGSAALVGWWLVAIPLGVVIGDLVGVWGLSPERQQRLVAPLAVAVFVPLLLFLTTPGFGLAWVLLLLSGLGAAYGLGLDGLLRGSAPEHLLGRAMAINTAGLISLQGLGFAAAGALAEVIPPAATIAVAGVAGLLVVATLRPRTARVARRPERPRGESEAPPPPRVLSD